MLTKDPHYLSLTTYLSQNIYQLNDQPFSDMNNQIHLEKKVMKQRVTDLIEDYTFDSEEKRDINRFQDKEFQKSLFHAFGETFIKAGNSLRNLRQNICHIFSKAKCPEINFALNLLSNKSKQLSTHCGIINAGWNSRFNNHYIIILYYRKFMSLDYEVYIINAGDGIRFHGLTESNYPLGFFKITTSYNNLVATIKIQKEFYNSPDEEYDSFLYYKIILNSLGGKLNEFLDNPELHYELPRNELLSEDIPSDLLEIPIQIRGSCSFRSTLLSIYLIHVILMKNITKDRFQCMYISLSKYWIPRYLNYLETIFTNTDNEILEMHNAYNAYYCLKHRYTSPNTRFLEYKMPYYEPITDLKEKRFVLTNQTEIADGTLEFNLDRDNLSNFGSHLDTTFSLAYYLDKLLDYIVHNLDQERYDQSLSKILNLGELIYKHYETDPQYPILMMGIISLYIKNDLEKRNYNKTINNDYHMDSRKYHMECLSAVEIKSRKNSQQIEFILKDFYKRNLPFYVLPYRKIWIDIEYVMKYMDIQMSEAEDIIQNFSPNVDLPILNIWRLTSFLYGTSLLIPESNISDSEPLYYYSYYVDISLKVVKTIFIDKPNIKSNLTLYNYGNCNNNTDYPCIGYFNPVVHFDVDPRLIIKNQTGIFRKELEINHIPYEFKKNQYNNHIFNQQVTIRDKTENFESQIENIDKIAIQPTYTESDFCNTYSDIRLFKSTKEQYEVLFNKEKMDLLLDKTNIEYNEFGIFYKYDHLDYRYINTRTAKNKLEGVPTYILDNWKYFEDHALNKGIFVPNYVPNQDNNKNIIFFEDNSLHKLNNEILYTLCNRIDETDKVNIATQLSKFTEVMIWVSNNYIMVETPAYDTYFLINNENISWNGHKICHDNDDTNYTIIKKYISNLQNAFIIESSPNKYSILLLELYYNPREHKEYISFNTNISIQSKELLYNKSLYVLNFNETHEFILPDNPDAIYGYIYSCLSFENMVAALECVSYLSKKDCEALKTYDYNIPYLDLFTDNIDSLIFETYPKWLQNWYRKINHKPKLHKVFSMYINRIDDKFNRYALNYDHIHPFIKSIQRKQISMNTFDSEEALGINRINSLYVIGSPQIDFNKPSILSYDSNRESYLKIFNFYSFRDGQEKTINEIKHELITNENTSVFPLTMGSGKTKVIIPIVAVELLKEDTNNSVLIILPDILVNQTVSHFRNYIQFVFNVNVEIFKKETVIEKGFIYIASQTEIKKYIVRHLKEQANSLEGISHETVWSKINQSTDASVKVIIDEIDEVCDPSKSEYNEVIPYGRTAILHYDFQIKIITNILNIKFSNSEMIKSALLDERDTFNSEQQKYYNYITTKIPDVLAKKNRVHYGFANITENPKSFIVCPFKTFESPNIGSEFLNPTVTLIYMIAALYQDGIYYQMIKTFIHSMLNEPLQAIRNINIENLVILGLDVYSEDGTLIDEEALIEALLARNRDPSVIEAFMLWYKTTNTIMFNMHSYNVSHTDLLVHGLFDGKIGLTGTPEDFLRITDNDSQYGLVNVGKTKNISNQIIGLGKKNYNIFNYEKDVDITIDEYIIRMISTDKDKYDCLIDAGMIFINDTPKVVAQKLYQILQRDILYIEPHVKENENNIKIYRNNQLFDYNNEETDAFVFFGYHSITGFDIKMIDFARGLVTIGHSTTYRTLSQAIYRMRKIEQNQTIDYISDKTFRNTKHIFDFVVKNQLMERNYKKMLHIKQNILTIERQLNVTNAWMKNVVEQIPLSVSQEMSLFHEEHSKIKSELLDHLICLSKNIDNVVAIDQEIEVELELNLRTQINKFYFHVPDANYHILDFIDFGERSRYYYYGFKINNIKINNISDPQRLFLSPNYLLNYRYDENKEVCAIFVPRYGYMLILAIEYNMLCTQGFPCELIVNHRDEILKFPKGMLSLIYFGIDQMNMNLELLYEAYQIIKHNNDNEDLIEYVHYILSDSKCSIPNYVGLMFVYAKTKFLKISLFDFLSYHDIPFNMLMTADLNEMLDKKSADFQLDLHKERLISELKSEFNKFSNGISYVDRSSCIYGKKIRYILNTNKKIIKHYEQLIKQKDVFPRVYNLSVIQTNPELIALGLEQTPVNLQYLTLDQLLDNILKVIFYMNGAKKRFLQLDNLKKIFSLDWNTSDRRFIRVIPHILSNLDIKKTIDDLFMDDNRILHKYKNFIPENFNLLMKNPFPLFIYQWLSKYDKLYSICLLEEYFIPAIKKRIRVIFTDRESETKFKKLLPLLTLYENIQDIQINYEEILRIVKILRRERMVKSIVKIEDLIPFVRPNKIDNYTYHLYESLNLFHSNWSVVIYENDEKFHEYNSNSDKVYFIVPSQKNISLPYAGIYDHKILLSNTMNDLSIKPNDPDDRDLILLEEIYMPDLEVLSIENTEVLHKLKIINLPLVHTLILDDIDDIFNYDSELISINLDNLELIEKRMFNGCYKLEDISMRNLLGMEWDFLNDCDRIKDIKLPSVHTILKKAFNNSRGLKSIEMISLQAIHGDILNNCLNIQTINFPKLKIIGIIYGFNGCSRLERFECPKLEKINGNCLNGCHRLERIDMDSLTEIKGDFLSDCKQLEHISMNSLTEIKGDFLSDCEQLKHISMNSLITIPQESFLFYNCDLQKCHIELQSLNNPIDAFQQCTFPEEVILQKNKRMLSSEHHQNFCILFSEDSMKSYKLIIKYLVKRFNITSLTLKVPGQESKYFTKDDYDPVKKFFRKKKLKKKRDQAKKKNR